MCAIASSIIGHPKNESTTKDMRKYGLSESELNSILKNPYNVSWCLKQPASNKTFFTDLSDVLHKKRVPVKEIEVVKSQICEKSICCTSFECSATSSGPSDDVDDISLSVCYPQRYMKSNVKR